ncbi:MAG: 50S ribosomal protein L22 [Candidatus Paceibacterota bacterium]
MKASLINFRQPPRKVRLVADYLRGKTIKQALAELDFIGKKSSLAIKKLISAAVANAENNFQISRDKLFIKDLRVDKGLVIQRFMPRARGRATPLRHRTSHIKVELAELTTTGK